MSNRAAPLKTALAALETPTKRAVTGSSDESREPSFDDANKVIKNKHVVIGRRSKTRTTGAIKEKRSVHKIINRNENGGEGDVLGMKYNAALFGFQGTRADAPPRVPPSPPLVLGLGFRV